MGPSGNLAPKILMSIDEGQQFQRVSLIAHVFQLTCGAIVDTLLEHVERMSNCPHGCAFQQPSQRQHTLHALRWMAEMFGCIIYHDHVVKLAIDFPLVFKTAESVCRVLGIKLGKSWKSVRYRIYQVSRD